MSFPLILLFSDAPLNLSMKPTSLWGRPSPVPYEQAAHQQLASRDLDFLVNKHNLKCVASLRVDVATWAFPEQQVQDLLQDQLHFSRAVLVIRNHVFGHQLTSWQFIVGWSDAQAASWSQCSIFTLSPTLLPLLKKLPPSFLTWQVEAASMAQELVLVLVLYYLHTVARHMYKR